MMTGEYDAKAAYNAFNAQITDYKDPDAKEVMFTQENAYSNDFTDHGSAAASSLMNTIRASMEADIAIGYSPVASTTIYAGDYTLQQAKWVLTSRNSIYLGEYTGEEVYRFMDWLANVKEDGSNPIVAMTANAFAEDVQASLDAGMNGHIAKPIVLDEVVKAVVRNLRR